MATLDEIAETFDEMGISGDTPIRFKIEGEVVELGSIDRDRHGVVTLEFEVDTEQSVYDLEQRLEAAVEYNTSARRAECRRLSQGG